MLIIKAVQDFNAKKNLNSYLDAALALDRIRMDNKWSLNKFSEEFKRGNSVFT